MREVEGGRKECARVILVSEVPRGTCGCVDKRAKGTEAGAFFWARGQLQCGILGGIRRRHTWVKVALRATDDGYLLCCTSIHLPALFPAECTDVKHSHTTSHTKRRDETLKRDASVFRAYPSIGRESGLAITGCPESRNGVNAGACFLPSELSVRYICI